MSEVAEKVSRRTKLFSWLIMGSFSVFFAEVVSGSSMFPFFEPWGIIVIIPLYTLHILVLSYLVFNFSKPRFYTLFIAGNLFGMYEAYITKVLWSPPWGEAFILIGGIGVIEMIMLVFFWHPLWAFIIPLLAAEQTLTHQRNIVNGLPGNLQKLFYSKNSSVFLIILAIVAGGYQSANSPSPVFSLLSGLSTTAFLIFLIYIWRTKIKSNKYTMQDLLPSKKEFRIIFSLLILLYLVFGILLRPEALPVLSSQLSIWLIYSILFVLLYLSLKKSNKKSFYEISNSTNQITYKKCILLAIILTITSTIFTGIGAGSVIMPLMWISGVMLGILLFILSIRELFT